MKASLSFLFFAILLGQSAFSAVKNKAPTCADFQKTKNFSKFLDLYWTSAMMTSPEWATSVGYPGQNDRWSDQSFESHKKNKELVSCQLKSLSQISNKSLSKTEQLNFDLLKYDLTIAFEGTKFPNELFAVDHISGVHHTLMRALDSMPTNSPQDYENIFSRFSKIPELLNQTEDLLREGAKQKMTTVKMFLEKVPPQIEKLTPEKIEESPLFLNFKSANEETKTKAKNLLSGTVYPAFKKFHQFLVNDYIPKAQSTIAWTEMPMGKPWYDYLIKLQTSVSLTADEIHSLGLSEVARIKKEMEKVREQAKFSGDTKAFHKLLVNDSQFYFSKPEDLLASYRNIAKLADAELPKLFKTLPRLTYGVREIPSYKAAAAPTGYYIVGSLEGGRPGTFEANTYDLKSRPKWGMEALTLHEAVPGHHFQIAIAQERENQPEFRKHALHTAFVEGWGLYAESLGEEMGFYKDPYSKYGQLTFEMWRAIRLVVDTGMHAKGWSRDQAINYFMELTPQSRLEVEVEVDRYITWPGQALAYKIGELKFKELKAKAKSELGDNFNVRLFHDQVLGNGALPLPVLEEQFNLWLMAQKRELKRKG